jgi:hypothetical protein
VNVACPACGEAVNLPTHVPSDVIDNAALSIHFGEPVRLDPADVTVDLDPMREHLRDHEAAR